MIREIDLNGTTWFWLCRRFESDALAKRNYDTLQAEGERLQGELEIGCYRHGTSEGQMRYITCVSHKRDGMITAEVMLGGTNYRLADEVVKALVLRRARVVLDLTAKGAKPGVHSFPHPEGVKLNREGEIVET